MFQLSVKMLVDKANQCAANTGTGAGVTIGNSTETLLSKVTEVEADVVATTKETEVLSMHRARPDRKIQCRLL